MPPTLADAAWSEYRSDRKSNVARFAYTSFMHLAPGPFSPMHHEFSEAYQEDIRAGARGIWHATAALRGPARTGFKSLIKIIHDCVYGLEAFIVVIGSTSTLAEDKGKMIRDELESNWHLNQVYGCQVGPRWNQADFVTCVGTWVIAVSPKTQVHGPWTRVGAGRSLGRSPTKVRQVA
jgi:hypothetical protein